MSMRKDGPARKPGVLDLWCTVFWMEDAVCAWAAEVYELKGNELIFTGKVARPAELV